LGALKPLDESISLELAREEEVPPYTFPKKKQRVSTYAKSKVAIARKKMNIKSMAWDANSLSTAWETQKKRSQLSSERIIKKSMDMEKL